jgi:RNA polymerase sigma-70 factor, ECF subfamily
MRTDLDAGKTGQGPRGVPRCAQETLSDDLLVARLRRGQVAAFDELIRRHEPRLRRLAVRFVHDDNDAREVLQDVLLSAWRKLPEFEGRSQVASWLHRVTVNAALMFLRKRQRRREIGLEVGPTASVDHETPSPLPWPDAVLQRAQLRRHLQAAIAELPTSLSTVLLERDVQGLSTDETALLLGLTRPAVKTRLHRARTALRATLHEHRAQ